MSFQSLFLAITCVLYFNNSNQTDSNALQKGLEFSLTRPEIIDDYSVSTSMSKNNCSKVVVLSSGEIDKATEAYFKDSDRCIVVLNKAAMFFESIESYVQIESFSEEESEYRLSLQLISPETRKAKSFVDLRYKIIDGAIDVIAFE